LASRRYFPSLDGLRALAIAPVVWHHATPRPLEGALGRGPLGVDLFFAISGFLITTLLLHEEKISLKEFWIRRSLRIFPLYYFVLGLYVAHALAYGDRHDFLGSVPVYATYTSNWLPHSETFAFAWSLASEEQFYLLWPLVLRFGRGRFVPALVMLAFVVVARGAERAIGLGALGAMAMHARPEIVRFTLGRRWCAPFALAAVLASAAFGWPLFPTHVAMAVLVVACCVRADHALAPLLENRALRHVGAVSYGIYLLNVSCVVAAKRLTTETWLVFVLGFAASVAAATLTRRFVERPFLSLRDARRPHDLAVTGA
jgi:peptidoglycan/LPS O-acetylase OafA/YrhL